MGTWSREPFGNDTAGDWSYRLQDSADLHLIEKTLDAALSGGDGILDATQGEEAVAACEVLLKLLNRGTQKDAYTDDVDAWVLNISIIPSDALKKKAVRFLEAVVSEKSMLLEMWEGDKDWLNTIASMKNELIA